MWKNYGVYGLCFPRQSLINIHYYRPVIHNMSRSRLLPLVCHICTKLYDILTSAQTNWVHSESRCQWSTTADSVTVWLKVNIDVETTGYRIPVWQPHGMVYIVFSCLQICDNQLNLSEIIHWAYCSYRCCQIVHSSNVVHTDNFEQNTILLVKHFS